MFPIHDDNPTTKTPVVTLALIALNVVIFFYELSLPEAQLESFFRLFAVVPVELSAGLGGQVVGQPVAEWLTPITSQFLHGGWLHLVGNMLFLWIFGNNIEDQLGHVKFLLFYLTCGILAALSQWFFSMGSDIPSLGASGAIAGVMGAYILRFPQARILTLLFLGIFVTTVRIPAVWYLGIWFVQQAVSSVLSLGLDPDTGGVAYWAHAGGFVFGAVLGPLMGLMDGNRR